MAKITVEHIDEELQAPGYISEAPELIEEHPQEVQAAGSPKRKKALILSFIGFLMVISVVIYMVVRGSDTKKAPVSTQIEQAPRLSEAEELHQKLSQTLDLPAEIPNLATVQDVEKVKDQLFFTRAQNGDKVLLYVKAGQAVLYRPSSGKVINLAPIGTATTPGQDAE